MLVWQTAVVMIISFVITLSGPLCEMAQAKFIDPAQIAPDTSSHDENWVADPNRYKRISYAKPNLEIRLPVLEYHDADFIPDNSLGLRPHQFYNEAKWLSSHGYHTINFGQLYAAMYFAYPLPSKPVLITFDDGYESVYQRVYPVLKEFHEQATVFMIGGYIGLREKWPMLTKQELQAMQQSGYIDVESHTVTHPDLSQASEAENVREIRGSAQILEHIVGHPIRFFCYPSGKYSEATIRALKASGYLLATVQGHSMANLRQGPYALHRIVIYDTTSLAEFAQLLRR